VVTTRDLLDRVLGPLVLLISLAVGFMYWQQGEESHDAAERDRAISEYNRAVTECQARFNQVVAEQVTIRGELSSAATAALQRVVQSVGKSIQNPPTTPAAERREDAAFRRLFANYDRAVDRLERQRDRRPLPEFPDCTTRAEEVLRSTASPSASPFPSP
jgi:hypothetical protein